jgi:hypothetical protein
VTRETLLIATRRPPADDAEAEPVLIETGRDHITLTLDDGERLEFDRTELAAAINPATLIGATRRAA